MKKTLSAYRLQIDAIDRALLSGLAKRAEVSRAIGKFKKAHGLNSLDAKRLGDMLKRRAAAGKSKKLSTDFVERIFKLIHTESLRLQNGYENRR